MPNDMTKYNRANFTDKEWIALENEVDRDYEVLESPSGTHLATKNAVTWQQANAWYNELVEQNPGKSLTLRVIPL